MKFIRKHAAAAAVLSAAAAVFAAPYLVPLNPDSQVFRSAVLPLLLFLAAIMPVREGFERADSRTLISSALWSLLFAGALSLGSELFVYDELLPGMGSMLRRIAVPFMAVPFFSGIVCRICTAEEPFRRRTFRFSMLVYMAGLLICWLPILLTYFPGALNYDFTAEYWQYLCDIYSNRHPLLYLMVNNGFIMLGGLFGSRTVGTLLATVLLHMLPLAAALAYSLSFMQKRSIPAWALALTFVCFGFMPTFSLLSVSMAKDVPFAAALLTLTLLSWECLEDPDAFLHDRKRCAVFLLTALLTAHLRNNGLFALLFLFPALLAGVKGRRIRMAGLMAASCAASFAVTGILYAAVPVTGQPSYQLYSIPAQQLVRAYNLGDLSEEEKTEIEGWFTESYGLRLLPHLADGAKGALDNDRLESSGNEFLTLWSRIGKKCPLIYAEAFLMLNIGSWYPDDLSSAAIYENADQHGYMETHRFDQEEYGINSYCLIPALKTLLERICRSNRYQKWPLVPYLFCTATPFWVLLLGLAVLASKGYRRLILPAFGVLGVWLSFLFGPCTLVRYTLPLFTAAPAFLLTALSMPRKK